MIEGDRQDKLIVAMDFGIKATIINHLKRLETLLFQRLRLQGKF